MFAIHVLTVVFSLCVIFLADKEGMWWILGRKQTLNYRRVQFFHYFTWVCITTLIISGAILALPQLSYLLTQPLFIMKMLFVAILLINAILIGRFSDIATKRPFATLSRDEMMPLFTSGALSFFSWVATIVIALVLFQ